MSICGKGEKERESEKRDCNGNKKRERSTEKKIKDR